MTSRRMALRGLTLLCVGSAVLGLALAAGVAHARPKQAKRYGIEGKFLGYDEGRKVFTILVTSREAKGFGGSTVGGKAPSDIEPGKEREFSVQPEGSVLSRTVIKSAKGTGVDNTGTQEGFRSAVLAIPTDRSVALSIERKAERDIRPGEPEYLLKTVVIQMTQEEIRRRLEELLQDE